jgi:hypothetical protein
MGVTRNAVGSRWIILCHNCAASADSLEPRPHSVEGLKMRLQRDRRWGDRRAAAVGKAKPWKGFERRDADRREAIRDDDDLVEEIEESAIIVELEADYEDPASLADKLTDIEEVTGIHFRIDPT